MATRTGKLPESDVTRHSRTAWSLSSTGLSMKYCRLGAVNRRASSVGKSWVAAFHVESAGSRKETDIGSDSSPRIQTNDAGMFRWAWVSSTWE